MGEMKALFVVFLIILVCFVSSSVAGTTYYINVTTGDDWYDGLAAEWDGVHGPFKTIYKGIITSADGDTIMVADGTYKAHDIDFSMGLATGTRNLEFRSENGPEKTIIDCEDLGRGFYFHRGETPATRVDGFTITGGYTESNGGAMYASNNPTVTNCLITGNSARHGGGIYMSASPEIKNCVISDNLAEDGAGIYISHASPEITNCEITNNIAPEWNSKGGAPNGGGIYFSNSNAPITNCILWGNEPQQVFVESGTPVLTYCDIEGGRSGTGWNILDEDPLFVHGASHDYYLSQAASYEAVDSPCVDRGDGTAVALGLDTLATRSDGMSDTGTVDMGYHAQYALWIYSITRNGSDNAIRWNALSGVAYTVQHSIDMETWTDVAVGVTSTWTDIGVSETTKFYRVFEE